MGLSQYTDRRRGPAQQRLVHDAQGQHVESGQCRILTPGKWRGGIRQRGAAAIGVHFAKFTQIALCDQLAHHLVPLEAKWAGDNLRHQLRVTLGRLVHAMRLGGVHAHARLGEHMLAGLERSQGDRAVQVGPGADDHCVDIRQGHNCLPVRADDRDIVLAGYRHAGFVSAIAHRHDLDVGTGTKSGDMPQARVGAGADQPHAQSCMSHGISRVNGGPPRRPAIAESGRLSASR